MPLRFYNTMTRDLADFVPIKPGRVSMYTCGPTVWNYAHIGNFRTFLFEDLLRRWLEASGYEVYHIMNLTDVDDRTIKAAADKGLSLREHVGPYTQAFFEDRDYLRIRPAHDYPRATQFIAPMIALVERLLENGTAYQGEDGSVYFSIERFPAYGRLSRLDTRELKTGASGRASSDEYAKEDARDFALWKAVGPVDEQVGAAWDAPFGRGRPGWHLECSAMALDLLGRKWGEKTLDIHAGGVDLIFPHHEDEIAQSCAFTGLPDFARVWMHAEFLNVRGTKMSKRFGNITTARDLQGDGVDAGAIRLLMFQTHYRQKLDLTDDALAAASRGSERLGEFERRLNDPDLGMTALTQPGSERATADLLQAALSLEETAAEALNDDLNAPQAVAALFDFANAAHRAIDAGATVTEKVRGVFRRWSKDVLDVLPGAKKVDSTLTAWVEERLETRREAKKRRDFTTADAIRAELAAKGVILEDTPTGTKWRLG
ncbi:MAG TPA: cysteine--tRNA ligase [Gemmatimonadales bacterium]|nr:cysteine--tRNA ligase [Gemmatimonadales bacterium]